MTQPKDHRSYPPAFGKLIEAASVRAVEIECETEQKAKSLQGRLHQYIGVLHRNALANKELVPLDTMARKVRVKAVGTKLTAIPRDEEEDNLLIMKGLEAGQLPSGNMSPEMAELFAKTLT